MASSSQGRAAEVIDDFPAPGPVPKSQSHPASPSVTQCQPTVTPLGAMADLETPLVDERTRKKREAANRSRDEKRQRM
eukprot:1085492-Prymnesium_polylepis.1